MTLNVALIRHGQIGAEYERRLVGITDDPLGYEGGRMIARKKEAGAYPGAEIVFTSDLSRCVETARLAYDRTPVFRKYGFCAPDYGDFEGRTFSELENDEGFKRWQSSELMTACPDGELLEDFSARVTLSFKEVCGFAASEGFLSIAVVSHRTVIGEILRRYYTPRSNYAAWEVLPGCGYLLRYDTETFEVQIAGKF